MQNSSKTAARSGLLLTLFVLGTATAATFVASQFQSQAVSPASAASQPVALQDKREAMYFDIRDMRSGDKNEAAEDARQKFRQDAGRTASSLADVKDAFVRGEELLKERIPTLKVEYNHELQNPEVIAPDIMKGGGRLTGPTTAKRADVLRDFVLENKELVGLSSDQISDLRVTADYKNPQGELSFARLEQFVGDIPVFRAEIRAGFAKDGSMFRVVNNSAPGLDYASLSQDFGDPAEAVRLAGAYINHEFKKGSTILNEAESTSLKVKFGQGDWATTAEKMYFPVEPGVARAAWRVLTWEPGDAFYVIVDAETGTMLYRENITRDQTQASTFNVYASTTNMLRAMPNPAPIAAPGLLDPAIGTQPPLQARSNVTLIGNEAPFTFNNLGWITDNTNTTNGHTDGNAVEAGVDRDSTNGVDAPVQGTNRVYNFSYTPGAGPSGGPGDDPTTTPAYQAGAGTNLFYVTNRFHDETYLLGWTEQARNFQASNFGRGGAENDRISAEAQDDTVGPSCSARPCANNANFSTPADGGRGRMQMYIWNRMTPIRDGDLDAEIIVHEFTHGLFGRLHNGVGGTQAGQMNEGNSDFFAHVMLSNLADPINIVSTTGGYSTLNLRTAAPFSSVGNYYYGIRRFPKAVKAFTGGPNNRPHNPLTYADIDSAQMNLTDGAYGPAFTGSATAVHDGGEIWSSMLWEIRAKLATRLGAANGNRKVLQLVMDGMKVSPSNPTMKAERDAILSAAQANGNAADLSDVWAGFASRGLGFSATNTTGNTVVEAFDMPNAVVTDPFSVSDAPGDNDGFPEPTENVILTISVTNTSGETINNVQINVNGGANVSFGTIANGATVTNPVPYFIPAGAVCGSMHAVTIGGTSSVGAMGTVTKSFRLGAPVGGAPVSFSNTTAVDMPSGQPTTTAGPSAPYPSNIAVSGLTGRKVIKLTFNGYRHEFEDDLDFLLVGPGGQKFVFMSDVGGSTEQLTPITFSVSDRGDTLLPDAAAIVNNTTYRPSNVGATDPFDAPAPAGPYENAAPGGTATFASVFGSDGASMNGTWSIYVDDDATGDWGRLDGGWTMTFEADDFNCTVGTATSFSVGGRVVDAAGRGITNALVKLTNGGTVMTARTGSFGYFTVLSVPGGNSYTATVNHKRYTFASQSVNPSADVTNLNFTANP